MHLRAAHCFLFHDVLTRPMYRLGEGLSKVAGEVVY